MNPVDGADQLRKNYEVEMNLRQRKWWRSVYLWAFDIAIFRAFLLYKQYYTMHDLDPLSHYRFQEQVILAWMDSETNSLRTC